MMHKEDLAFAKLILKSYLCTFLEKFQFKSNLPKGFCACGSYLHSNNFLSKSFDIQGQKMMHLLTSDWSISKQCQVFVKPSGLGGINKIASLP